MDGLQDSTPALSARINGSLKYQTIRVNISKQAIFTATATLLFFHHSIFYFEKKRLSPVIGHGFGRYHAAGFCAKGKYH